MGKWWWFRSFDSGGKGTQRIRSNIYIYIYLSSCVHGTMDNSTTPNISEVIWRKKNVLLTVEIDLFRSDLKNA